MLLFPKRYPAPATTLILRTSSYGHRTSGTILRLTRRTEWVRRSARGLECRSWYRQIPYFRTNLVLVSVLQKSHIVTSNTMVIYCDMVVVRHLSQLQSTADN